MEAVGLSYNSLGLPASRSQAAARDSSRQLLVEYRSALQILHASQTIGLLAVGAVGFAPT